MEYQPQAVDAWGYQSGGYVTLPPPSPGVFPGDSCCSGGAPAPVATPSYSAPIPTYSAPTSSPAPLPVPVPIPVSVPPPQIYTPPALSSQVYSTPPVQYQTPSPGRTSGGGSRIGSNSASSTINSALTTKVVSISMPSEAPKTVVPLHRHHGTCNHHHSVEASYVLTNSGGGSSTPRQPYSWKRRVAELLERAAKQERNNETTQSFETLKTAIHYLQKVLEKFGTEMSQEERKEAIETMTLLFTRAKPLDPRAPPTPTPAIVPSSSGSVPHHPRQAPALVRRNTAPVGKHNSSVASPASPSPSSSSTATSSPQAEGASRYPRISYYDSVKFNVIQVDERQFKNALSKLGTASTPSPTHTPLVSSPSPSYSPSPYSQMPLGSKSMGTLIPLTPGTAPSPPVDSQLAGKVVDTTHSSWWITMALLSGLNYSISRTSLAEVDIATVDAENFEEFKVSDLTQDPSLFPTPFEFINHAPLVFREIRKLANISTTHYLESLRNNLCELKSPGKSDSLFYFSFNRQFIIKTVNEEEFTCFKGYLLCYYGHLKQYPESLLIRFFSLHSIRTGDKTMHFVVMENLSPTHKYVSECYDLKGSSVGRKATDSEKQKKGAILKDLDFNRRLFLGPEKRQIFFDQISRDCSFLAEHNVMDYSLLLSIHDISKPTPPHEKSLLQQQQLPPPSSCRPSKIKDYEGGIRATDLRDGPMSEVYYLGIIDIMQPYNWRKQVESSLKGFLDNPEEISCIEPSKYAKRFLGFLQKKAGVAMIQTPSTQSEVTHHTTH